MENIALYVDQLTARGRGICTGAALGGFLYAVGGEDQEDNNALLASVERYDIVSGQWSAVASMASARRQGSTVALGGHVYAIGGWDVNAAGLCCGTYMNAVERYDPDSDSWSLMQPMGEGRVRLSLVALDGFIYAIGGEAGSGIRLASVERYDPGADAWTTMASMNENRAGQAAAVVDGVIYVAGGRYWNVPSKVTAEKYDPSTNSWTMIAPMNNERSFFPMVAFDGYIYAIGGEIVQQGTCVDSIERYNPSTNTWDIGEAAVAFTSGGRCQAAAVVV